MSVETHCDRCNLNSKDFPKRNTPDWKNVPPEVRFYQLEILEMRTNGTVSENVTKKEHLCGQCVWDILQTLKQKVLTEFHGYTEQGAAIWERVDQ